MTAGLVYVSDREPGIARRRCGRGFTYIAPDGTSIARGSERSRIEALAVPPAYTDVWICCQADGHLQATGRDARRRKQYRYHPDWSGVRAETKFNDLAAFGHCLPKIRRRVARDLQQDAGELDFARATAVRLIDRAALRVGNPAYTRQNGSYGALTLQGKHMKRSRTGIDLQFIAKGGKEVCKSITDARLQMVLQKVNDLPGATLLTWVAQDGSAQSLSSQDLNQYLADAAGTDRISSKTFRTWAGTLAAFECAEAGATRVNELADAAAQRLHNTPTVARTSYIHPAVIKLVEGARVEVDPAKKNGLSAAEQRLLGYLGTV